METLPVGVAIIEARAGTCDPTTCSTKIWGGTLPEINNVRDYAQFKAWRADTGKPVLPEQWASAQAVQKGETVIGQLVQIERFDGRRAFVMNTAPILDSDGKIAGSAVAILDVSEMKLAEERCACIPKSPLNCWPAISRSRSSIPCAGKSWSISIARCFSTSSWTRRRIA